MNSQYREIVILDGRDNTGPAVASAARNLSTWRSAANSVGSMVMSPVIRLVDMATAPLRMIASGAAAVVSALADIGLASIGLGALGDALGQLSQVFMGPLGLVDFLNRADIGFTTMLGSAEAAAAFMDKIKNFAIATPFGAQDLIQEAQFMLAMGVAADQVLPRLQVVGDAVSALGGTSENIHNVMRALLQMESMGKVNAQQMLALTRNNIDAWQMLAKGMGKTVAEVRAMSEAGDLQAADSVRIIMEAMTERFSGQMMANANRTMSGLKEQILDTFQLRVIARWGEGLESGVLPALQEMNEWLQGNADTLGEMGAQVAAFGGMLGGVFLDAAGRAISALKPVWQLISALFTGFTSDAGAFGLVGDLIENSFGKGAANAVRPFLQSLMDIVNVLMHGDLETALLLIPGRVVRAFRDAGRRVMGYLQGEGASQWFGSIGTALRAFGQHLWQDIRFVAMNVANELGLGSRVGGALDWIEQKWGELTTTVSEWATWIRTEVIPRAQELGSALLDRIGTALDWLINTGWPTLQTAAAAFWNWVQTTVLPLAEQLYEKLQYWVGTAVQWFIDYGWPALKQAAADAWTYIQTTVFPIIESLYTWLYDKVGFALGWLIYSAWPALRDAVLDAWAKIKTDAFPVLNDLYVWLTDKIGLALGWLIAYGWPTFRDEAIASTKAVADSLGQLKVDIEGSVIPYNLRRSWEEWGKILKDIGILLGDGSPGKGVVGMFLLMNPQLQGIVPFLSAASGAFLWLSIQIRLVLDALVALKKWWDDNGAAVQGAFWSPGQPGSGWYRPPDASGGGWPGGTGGTAPDFPYSPGQPSYGTTPGGESATPRDTLAPVVPVSPEAPHGARGAMVYGRTLMVVGEDAPARPEVVAPLDALMGMMGADGSGGGGRGDVHIHMPQGMITLNGAADDDVETLAARLAGPLARVLARQITGDNALSGELVGT